MGTTGTLHLRAFFRNHATVRRVYIRTRNTSLYRYIHRDDPQAPFRFIIILQNRTESYIIPIYYNNGRSIFFNFADSYQNTPFALTPQYLYIIIYIYIQVLSIFAYYIVLAARFYDLIRNRIAGETAVRRNNVYIYIFTYMTNEGC